MSLCITCVYVCYASALLGGGIKRCFCLTSVWCLTSVCLTSVCLSRTSGLTREQRDLGRLNWHRGSARHTWLGHHFQGQKVKGQLVADVYNSQHARTGVTWRINTKMLLCRNRTATWRINAKILSTCRGGGVLCRHAHSLLLMLLPRRLC